MKRDNVLYRYCKKLLEYIDPAGEIIHRRGCLPRLGGCTCGLESTIGAILKELEAYEEQS